MCAIAGILDLRFDHQVTKSMLSSMAHRGPDENGFFVDGSCCLLHSRLSIIDLDGGKQPMQLQWGDETYTIVYNGELYNTEEIRKELIRCGHRFDGHSDTEVLLHAYAQWKDRCLERLNGIFAFAVWEPGSRRLFIARDRMGVKPLFYAHVNGGLLFASEIKTILKHPDMRAELDTEGIAQVLLLGPGRIPGSGVFKNIYELEPGCCGVYQNNRFTWCRYWQLTDRYHQESFEETAETVRFLVTDAIKRQMVSDVPIGTFLSGGLDSSIISAICAKELSPEKLQTFSVDYENNDLFFSPGKFQPNSDCDYICIMAEHLGSEHRTTTLTAQQLVNALETATCARDLPGMADVDISLLLFCGQIRKNAKVALSGECADEIFGGYPWFRDPEVSAKAGFPWSQNVEHRAALLNRNLDAYEFVMDQYNDTIAACDILPDTEPTERRMKEMTCLNQRWFMQTLLDRKDRMSMHSGLEVRVPFCDHRIAQYLYSVPWEFKDYQGREKGLLRYAMEGLLPQEVLYRKKSPYPKTYDPAYLRMVRQRLVSVIADNNAPILEIIDRKKLTALLDSDPAWPWYGQLMRGPQTIAYMLQVNFWLQHYQIDIL